MKIWKDRCISSLISIGKKNKILKPILFLVMIVIICIYRLFVQIAWNQKKIIGICISFFMFVTTSSFASPSFREGIKEVEVPYQENVYSEEFEEVEYDPDADMYSVDEILKENDLEAIVEEIDTSYELQERFSKEDWNLVLINKQNPIPDEYDFTLGTIMGSMQCDERILNDLLLMLKAAKKDGVSLIVCSSFRDYSRQEYLLERKIKQYIQKGCSYLEAYQLSSQTVTVPGASEHQIGLAIDFLSDTYNMLNVGFGETKAGIWLKENGYHYGFILRYPEDKEEITGISYEPWHYRYVGVAAATVIMEEAITLEEFIERLDD
ncbi:MAG: M15 family metallopeptidase [Lachnospiraceae bacterium]